MISTVFVADSLNELHQRILTKLTDEYDYESSPRGKPIRELIGAHFVLTNPRNRIITSEARNVNYGFAVGELCWYLRGDNDLETMLFYNKRMSQFSDDGKTINSAYGARMFKERWNGEGQFSNVVQELIKDPDSRRAIMHINEPWDLRKAQHEGGSKDVPCTLNIQLLIRDRRLHMIVNMRSNDVVWGLPYDVFSFTCLQEAFLYTLKSKGVPVDDLGYYYHHAGSLHIYDTHFKLAEEVAGENREGVAPMAPFDLERLEVLAHDDEPSIRKDGWSDVICCPNPKPEEDTIGWMFKQLVDQKNKRIAEALNKEKNVEQT